MVQNCCGVEGELTSLCWRQCPGKPRRIAPSAQSIRVFERLLTQTKLSNDAAIAFLRVIRQVLQQAAAIAYHLQQTATRCVVFLLSLEVPGEMIDALGEQCNLYLRRASVTLVSLVFGDNLLLYFGYDIHCSITLPAPQYGSCFGRVQKQYFSQIPTQSAASNPSIPTQHSSRSATNLQV